MRHDKRIIIAAALLLWLLLCLPAAADILDDSYMTGYLSGAPNYTLMPETDYVVGSMSAAQSTLSSFISQCKSNASGKLEEYISGIRQHNIEVNGPDCKLEVTYGKPEIHVDVPQFGISGEPADDVTFTGRQLTTGGVTATYDIHVSATVSYELKNWSGGPFSDGNTWIPQDFVFFQEKTIARITIYAADRYADVVVSWDYPGETRDLEELGAQYSGFRDALNISQSYNFEVGLSQNMLKEGAFNPFNTHSTRPRTQDVVYFFYSGRGDAGGMRFTNGWQEEYVPFSAFAQQAARIPCHLVLVLDVIADHTLTNADLSAFSSACADIAAAGSHVCVLGCISDINRSQSAPHFHTMTQVYSNILLQEPFKHSFLLFGLADALNDYTVDRFSMLDLRSRAGSWMQSVKGENSDFSYLLTVRGPQSEQTKPVFYPYGYITQPLTAPAPETLVIDSAEAQVRTLYGRDVYWISPESGRQSLLTHISINVLPENAFCRCYTCEIVDSPADFPIDRFPAGAAELDTDSGLLWFEPLEPGLVTVRVRSVGNPELYQDVLFAICSAPEQLDASPFFTVLDHDSEEELVIGRTPKASWPGVSFEPLRGNVRVSQEDSDRGIAYFVGNPSPDEWGVLDVIRVTSELDENVQTHVPVLMFTGASDAYALMKGEDCILIKSADRQRQALEIGLMDGNIDLVEIGADGTPSVTRLQANNTKTGLIRYYRDSDGHLNIRVEGVGLTARGTASAGFTVIDKNACSKLTGLVYVSLAGPVRRVESGAFSGCSALQYALIPDNVLSIRSNAFPAGIEIAGDAGSAAEAYAQGTGQTFRTVSVSMPSGDTVPADTLYVPVIDISPAWLDEFGVEWQSSDENVLAVCADGTIRAKRAGTAVLTATVAGQYTASCTVSVYDAQKLRLPRDTERIEADAFRASGIVCAVLNENCAEIGEYAFAGCADLAAVVFPDGVNPQIAATAFEGCARVTFLCAPGSAAAEFADAHGIPYAGWEER